MNGNTSNVTSCHEMFSFDKRNRPIDSLHVARLMASIKERNLLSDHPILVTADGIVLDGQHRLEAARRLGVPIWYTIAQDTTIYDVRSLNTDRDKWGADDVLHFHASQGNEEYIYIQKVVLENPDFKMSAIIGLLMYGDAVEREKEFNGGTFKCKRRKFANVVMSNTRAFSSIISWYTYTVFLRSIASCVDTQGYDNAKMLRKATMLGDKFKKQVDVTSTLEHMTYVYNYKEPESRHVTFKNRGRRNRNGLWIYPED